MIIKGKKYSLEDAREKFLEDFIDLIGELESSSSDSDLVKYYSTLCQNPNREPTDDLWIFEADLFDKGWNDKLLRELFDVYTEQIINQLDDKSRGVGDYFLYKWTNKKFPLAGYKLYEEPEDVMMKYSYGWQRHKYGILFLNQNGYDKDKFLSLVAESFYDSHIIDRIMNLLEFDVDRNKKEKYIRKFKKFGIVKANILEIQYKRIVEILNVMNFVEGGSMHEDIVDPKDFREFVITTLDTYEYASYEEKTGSIFCRFDA